MFCLACLRSFSTEEVCFTLKQHRTLANFVFDICASPFLFKVRLLGSNFDPFRTLKVHFEAILFCFCRSVRDRGFSPCFGSVLAPRLILYPEPFWFKPAPTRHTHSYQDTCGTPTPLAGTMSLHPRQNSDAALGPPAPVVSDAVLGPPAAVAKAEAVAARAAAAKAVVAARAGALVAKSTAAAAAAASKRAEVPDAVLPLVSDAVLARPLVPKLRAPPAAMAPGTAAYLASMGGSSDIERNFSTLQLAVCITAKSPAATTTAPDDSDGEEAVADHLNVLYKRWRTKLLEKKILEKSTGSKSKSSVAVAIASAPWLGGEGAAAAAADEDMVSPADVAEPMRCDNRCHCQGAWSSGEPPCLALGTEQGGWYCALCDMDECQCHCPSCRGTAHPYPRTAAASASDAIHLAPGP